MRGSSRRTGDGLSGSEGACGGHAAASKPVNRGAVLHGARTAAPIITLCIPGTPLQTTPPPTEACTIHSKQRPVAESRTPGGNPCTAHYF